VRKDKDIYLGRPSHGVPQFQNLSSSGFGQSLLVILKLKLPRAYGLPSSTHPFGLTEGFTFALFAGRGLVGKLGPALGKRGPALCFDWKKRRR
jgi:hypothetical protein